ncbi:MAG: pitrilysin family protein [Nannocystaceae bacterium]
MFTLFRHPPARRSLFSSILLGTAALSGCTSRLAPDAVDPTTALATGHATGGVHSTPPVLLPVPDDATISYNVWFKVGSQDDPQGKEGLASLTAAMLSEGATLTNSYEQIVEKLYPMAADYRANVDREMTTFTGRTHRDTANRFQALFTDAFTRPAFEASDLERLRSQAVDYLEKTLRYASDEELGKATLHGFIYEDTAYAHPPTGTVAGLQSISIEDIQHFYRRHYTQDRVVFGLGGGYDQERLDALERTRGLLSRAVPAATATATTATPAVPAPVPFQGVNVRLVTKPGADASISAGFPIDVHRGEKDFYALWVANSWLGEHRNSSSHLYDVIRAKRGLNYGDYSYIEAFTNGGRRSMPPTNIGRRAQSFELWVRTLPNEQAHFALRAAIRELALLVENGMTQAQFDLTRSFLRKYVLHFADTTSARLGYAVDDRFYNIDGSHLANFAKMMEELTLDDVNAAIKRHLQYQNIKVGIVSGKTEELRQALATDAPSPITYGSEKPAEVLAEDQLISTYQLNILPQNIQVVPVDQMFQH